MAPVCIHTCIQRAKAAGVPRAHTCAILGINPSTYTRRAKDPAQKRGPKPNSPRMLQRQQAVKEIALETKTNGKRVLPAFPSAPTIARELEKRLGIKVSVSTVWRAIKSGGGVCRVRPAHPGFRNAAKRAEFARKWSRARDGQLARIVFSDEHFISINDHSSRIQYVYEDEDGNIYLLPREMQRRQNIPYYQIWAAIGVGWRSELVFFPRTQIDVDSEKGFRGWAMTSKKYRAQCLGKIRHQLEAHDSIFMQDGATSHTAKATMDYFEQHGIELLEGFPSGSPDMNPIEKLWARLDALIAEEMPDSDASLKKAAKKAWASISQDEIDRFVLSFKGACQKVAKNEGR